MGQVEDHTATLKRCAALLLRYGGLKVAAGLTLESGRIKELRAGLNEYADERLGPDDLRPRIRIDDALAFRSIGGRLAAGLASMAPFGPGNPRPVFCAAGVDIVDGPRRLKDRHYKMALRQDGRVLRAIAWRGADRHAFLESHRAPVDVAFSLDRNEFNGEVYLELSLCDIRPCAEPAAAAPASA